MNDNISEANGDKQATDPCITLHSNVKKMTHKDFRVAVIEIMDQAATHPL